MAQLFSDMGGGSGGSTGQVGNNAYAQISPLLQPELLKLFKLAQSSVPTSQPSLESTITSGINSPLLSAVLGPALERLRAPQAEQRMQLTDQARAAGGLRGSPYANASVDLLNKQGLQTNDLIGTIISQILGTLISGQLQENKNAFLPANAYTDLLNAGKPQIVTGGLGGGGSGGSGGSGSSLGLDTPMSPTPNFDAHAAWLNRPMGGGGILGPNAPGMHGNPAEAPYNPYSNVGIPGVGGAGGGGGGGQIIYNPTTGFYESAPANTAYLDVNSNLPSWLTSGMTNSDQGLLGYGQAYPAEGSNYSDTNWEY